MRGEEETLLLIVDKGKRDLQSHMPTTQKLTLTKKYSTLYGSQTFFFFLDFESAPPLRFQIFFEFCCGCFFSPCASESYPGIQISK